MDDTLTPQPDPVSPLDGAPSKWWLSSTTVQGALMTYVPIAVMVLGAFGVRVGNDEANAIITGCTGVVGAIGALLAIMGRFNVSQKITLSQPKV